ncbi:MAG: Ppx/GppA phosphatase family protein [Candidatus Pacebacteria bacterium]|nr:Ppx/GppA phosphatase family protein [Candidatus Paceibacterota bacterium]
MEDKTSPFTHQNYGFDRVDDADAVYGALDLGTNNCRLLLAKKRPATDYSVVNSFEVVDVFSRLVKLGDGLNHANMLNREAILRCITALKICAGKIALHRPVAMRLVATEACRRARNIDSFINQVWRETGLEIEVISAEEEARLVMEACIHLTDPSIPYAVVFDIGGGSTEILWVELHPGKAPRMVGFISLPTGVTYRSLVQQNHNFKGLNRSGFDSLSDHIFMALQEFEQTHQIADKVARGLVQMVGSSGTVTTLSAIKQKLDRYDRSLVDNTRLDYPEVKSIIAEVLALSETDLRRHPIIGSGRSEFIVAGCAIVEALVRLWPVPQIIVADRGVRDGIILKLMNQDSPFNFSPLYSRGKTSPLTV